MQTPSNVLMEIPTRSSDATILVACASPLVSDKSVSEPCLVKQEKTSILQVLGIMPP